MKRSEVNSYLKAAHAMLAKINFSLPAFGYWTTEEWRKRVAETANIRALMIGWDVSDFGSGDFAKGGGAVLFTLRNGSVGRADIGTPYAEKLICYRDGQFIPLHYHAVKTEDIINRGGGRIWMELYTAKADGGIDRESPVTVDCDGVRKTVAAGERIFIEPGCSVTYRPRLYHLFGAEGDTVAGEVSSVNDDKTDNYFLEKLPRFNEIIEDEAPLHPLCNEYDKWL
jgi:D-lyxose ketol-isomerase